jgi:hypothetical protein
MRTAPVEIRFIRVENIADWLLCGWHDTGPLPGRHGDWSHCLEWICACPVVYPAGAK